MKKVFLFYDGDCPFCNRYSKFRQLQECINLELHDARENLLWKKYDSNLNLDDGVILIIENDSKVLQGIEAIRYLDTVCSFKGSFFKIQKYVFHNSFLAKIVYGIFKTARKLALYFTKNKRNFK